MLKWLKTNLLPLIVTVALTALFGWLLSTSDKLKDAYMAHAIENATDIAALKESDKKNDKYLTDCNIAWNNRMDKIEGKIDKIITQNAQDTLTSREMLGEIRGLQKGMIKRANE